MEKEYSEVEKRQVLEQFEKEQERLYLQGKRIVYVIAIINIIGAVVSAFIRFNFVTLIVQIELSLALLFGVPWVKYLFAVGLGLSGFLTLYLLLEHIDFSSQLGMVIYLVFSLLYFIVSCIVLFTSKSVSEFLYEKPEVHRGYGKGSQRTGD